MFQKNSKKLCSSFYPLYILLKFCGLFAPSFDSTYNLTVRIYGKIYAVCILLSFAALFSWNVFKNLQMLSNSSELLAGALQGSTIIAGISLLMALIYQYFRSDHFPQIFNIINQVDDKVSIMSTA